jgi:biopolymer transport protein TolR
MGAATVPQNGKKRYVSEINVTPLVDVVLVLLIIFMVTAPMMTKGLDVKLPETTAKTLPQKKNPLIITVNSGGGLFLNKVAVDEEVLRRRLSGMKDRDEVGQVLLRADTSVPYGVVAGVVAAVREAGIEDLGLVTQPSDSSTAGAAKVKTDRNVEGDGKSKK